MRLLANFSNQKDGEILSAYLKEEGIDNLLEVAANTDWGSPEYGSHDCKIWVIDEDVFSRAQEITSAFEVNPQDPLYLEKKKKASNSFSEQHLKPKIIIPRRKPPQAPLPASIDSMGVITLYILIICSLLFLYGSMTAPTVELTQESIQSQKKAHLPLTPFVTAPINKKLMFDYPEAFEILDKLNKIYGPEKVLSAQPLPAEGQYLLTEFARTPYWTGYYDIVLNHYKNPNGPGFPHAPLFEKIKKGEFWRLFTPTLLHYDIFHILFNMLWLVVLGKQIEKRLGKMRYLALIIISGVFSDVCQYLMTGSNFLGFSGVLCAMLAFVWARQRIAPWEGYYLQPSTLGFMAFFILMMVSIQLSSFFLEIYWNTPISPSVANTAHLTGALCGYVLGRLQFFHRQNK